MAKGYLHVKGGIRAQLNVDRFSRNFEEAQRELTFSVLSDTDEFLPFRTGSLANSPLEYPSELENGHIIYKGPYARYLYYGKVMVGSPPKTPIDVDLVFDTSAHPKAGAFWFDRSKNENIGSWVNQTKNIAGGRK